MSVALRAPQTKLVENVYKAWDTPGVRNVMPVAPTGFGKTAICAHIIENSPGHSVAIAHRRELVGQMSIALARNGVRHRVIGSSPQLIKVINTLHTFEFGYSYYDANAKVGVGGVDTIINMDRNDPYFKQVQLMMQDEAHHVLRVNKWGKVADMFPNARGLLPTATPIRADGYGLGRHADGIVDALILGPTMREVINLGYLTDYRIAVAPSDIDMINVEVSKATGDFNKDQLKKAVHKSHIVGDTVKSYLKFARNKLGVTFAVDVGHAGQIAQNFRDNGVSAEVISANTPDVLRVKILREFAARKILMLVNVDLFGEGFDLPAIEVVIFARPTASYALYCQQFGRALRLLFPDYKGAEWERYMQVSDDERRALIAKSSKPFAMIIDQVGSVMRHGLPDKEREWSLDRRERKAQGRSDAIPLKICTNPVCAQPYERVHKACPHCGEYIEPAGRVGPKEVDGDLTELDPEMLEAMRGNVEKYYLDEPMPYNATAEIIGAKRKQYMIRRALINELRNTVAWWAGLQAAKGYDHSESYRRFYFKYGVDVASAQLLPTGELRELNERISGDLKKVAIDSTVNAGII